MNNTSKRFAIGAAVAAAAATKQPDGTFTAARIAFCTPSGTACHRR